MTRRLALTAFAVLALALTLTPASALAGGARAQPAPVAVMAAAGGTLGPNDIHSAYALPKTGPRGQTIAMVVPYDHPSAAADLAAYTRFFGVPRCGAGCFRKLNQKGAASPLPARDPTGGTWTVEASLGTQVARGMCQNCSILLVEADSDSAADLSVAVQTAARAGATVVLTTFTVPEQAQYAGLAADYVHPGTTVVAATGDGGYTGDATFPGSLPNVVAVGGTHLKLSASGKYLGETVWSAPPNATTSGCSLYTPAPAWQAAFAKAVGCKTFRAEADIAAVAQPGVLVHITGISSAGGPWYEADGTSLAAPVIAGAFALAGPAGAGLPPQLLYKRALASPSSLHDVTTGSDYPFCSGRPICAARRGFDGPTGLGTPDGLRAFGGLDPRFPGIAAVAPHGRLNAKRSWQVPITLRNFNPFAVTVSLTLRLAPSPSTPSRGEAARVLKLAEIKGVALASGQRLVVSPAIARGARALLRQNHRTSVLAVLDEFDAGGRRVEVTEKLTLVVP